MNIIDDILYPQFLKSHAVTTDSRAVTAGCIFFALKGENFDGNAFAAQALQQGAALCVVSNPAVLQSDRMLLVPDVLETLQALAYRYRQALRERAVPVIGITGTNGKTTTKELVHAVLSRRYRTHATQGNYNNHLGVPLTLLATPPDAEIVIVEMGANHPGEIADLCRIAEPTAGLITTIGKAHLEGFGSLEGVLQTKTELYQFLALQQGTAFVNEDNALLMEKAMALSSLPDSPSPVPGYVPGLPTQFNDVGKRPLLSVMTYGGSETADLKGSPVSTNPYLKFYFENDDKVYTVQTQLVGGYNFVNAMAAVCVGHYYNVELFDVKLALEEYTPKNHRSEYLRTQRNELILDCYNANPSSMAVALQSLLSMPQPNKWVCLGNMKELGDDSRKEHEALVKKLLDSPLQGIVLVGEEFRFAADKVLWFATSAEAADYLRNHPIEEAVVLLKGSNATRMWTLQEVL